VFSSKHWCRGLFCFPPSEVFLCGRKNLRETDIWNAISPLFILLMRLQVVKMLGNLMAASPAGVFFTEGKQIMKQGERLLVYLRLCWGIRRSWRKQPTLCQPLGCWWEQRTLPLAAPCTSGRGAPRPPHGMRGVWNLQNFSSSSKEDDSV